MIHGKNCPCTFARYTIIPDDCFVGNGVDIDSNSRNITFECGRRTVNLIIPINDDNIFEQVETVIFSLQVPPDLRMIGVQLGIPSEVLGIIFDDEGIYNSVKYFLPQTQGIARFPLGV